MATLMINNVSHFYHKHCALRNVYATLKNGVVALVGPNGAGKTTLINIIVGLLQPTNGDIVFNGTEIRKLNKFFYQHVGYCPQSPTFYSNFTAKEFLLYMGSMKNIPKEELHIKTDELIKLVNLEEKKNKKISTFSGGMKQRLGIAQAMLGNPELLILDEPTAGLDPIERIRFRNLISQISEKRIVILATHIITDVESIANQILFLKKGRVLANENCESILKKISNSVWIIPQINSIQLNEILVAHITSNVRKVGLDTYEVKVINSTPPTPNAYPGTPTLEDAFLFYFQEKEGD